MLSFAGFAERGGHPDEHRDGWGIAFFEGARGVASVAAGTGGSSHTSDPGDKGLRLFVDSTPAATSPVAGLVARYPIKSRNVIAHIRKATQGPVSLENCRLFVRELWSRYCGILTQQRVAK
jgi:glutamine amidotransferase